MRFFDLRRRTENIGATTADTVDRVLHGCVELMRRVRLLGELRDPADSRSLEDERDGTLALLQVVRHRKGIENASERLFGSTLRGRQARRSLFLFMLFLLRYRAANVATTQSYGSTSQATMNDEW